MSELGDYFLKLEQEKWSGEVQVSSSEGNAFVILDRGQFIYAHRPIDRAVDRLSKLKSLKLPPAEIISSSHTWEDFVKHLLSLNIQDADKLTQFLKSDRLELFFRMFFWRNVELTARAFDVNSSSSPTLSFYSKRELQKLVNEALSRIEEWPLIQKRIGSGRRIFVSRVARSDPRAHRWSARDAIDSAISEFEGGTQSSPLKDFSESQSDILNLCNGANSVQEIVRLSADGEFLTLRRMIDLWDKGLIAPKEEEGSASTQDIKILRSWNDAKATLVSISLLCLTLFFFKFAVLPRAAPQVSAELLSALEIYRAEKGRYPVSLQELQATGLFSSQKTAILEYQLIHLTQYQIRVKKD